MPPETKTKPGANLFVAEPSLLTYDPHQRPQRRRDSRDQDHPRRARQQRRPAPREVQHAPRRLPPAPHRHRPARHVDLSHAADRRAALRARVTPVFDRPMKRLLITTLIAHAALAAVAQATVQTAPSAGLDTVVQPFFAEHCNRCHGPKKQKGDLRTDTLKIDFDSPKIMGHWEEIMNRINSGDMPPGRCREAAEAGRYRARGRLDRRAIARGGGGDAGVGPRARRFSQALARGIREHDSRSARRDLRSEGRERFAGGSGLERLRAHRLGAHAVAGARGKIHRRRRDGARRSAVDSSRAEARAGALGAVRHALEGLQRRNTKRAASPTRCASRSCRTITPPTRGTST